MPLTKGQEIHQSGAFPARGNALFLMNSAIRYSYHTRGRIIRTVVPFCGTLFTLIDPPWR